MTTAQKQPSEKEFKEEVRKKLLDELREYPADIGLTCFGRHKDAVKEFGRRIREFKDSAEIIRVNDIGIGFTGLEAGIGNISYEPLELLNEARNGGIRPEQVILYAGDLLYNALFYLKSANTIRIHIDEENSEYVKGFLPEFQSRMDENMDISVRIPEEWRKRILYLKLNILEEHAPVKAHLTFSYILPVDYDPRYLENLVASTRRGGYVFYEGEVSDEAIQKLNLELIQPGYSPFKREKLFRVR
jgi:hypothetical protein